jgi:adenylate cyclase
MDQPTLHSKELLEGRNSNTQLASPQAASSSAANHGPGDLSRIRQGLRSALDQIFGCCELLQDSEGRTDSEFMMNALDEIGGVAGCIRAVLDASGSAHANRSLRNFSERLHQMSTHVRSCVEQLHPGLGASLEPDSELRHLDTSSQLLVRLAEELKAYNTQSTGNDLLSQSLVPLLSLPEEEVKHSEMPSNQKPGGLILIADDNEGNRILVARRLQRDGYSTMTAADGPEALNALRRYKCDLLLLDIVMPGLDGLGVLKAIKQDPELRETPVIVISAVEEVDSVAACIQAGAEDYLSKPIEAAVLRARVRSLMERIHLRNREKRQTEELRHAMSVIEHERRRSDDLLRNILPAVIADELRTKNSVDPMYFEDVTIVFTDFAGFTLSTENIPAEDLVMTLHNYFTAFDEIVCRYGLEKLKTIGDSYLYVGGLPERSSSHPVDAVLAALEIVQVVENTAMQKSSISWPIRIGVHTGPVIAGVVGIHKFAFDIWGESVNFASRMETAGAPNKINISERTYGRIKDFLACESRGLQQTKDGRQVEMYFAVSVSSRLVDGDGGAFAKRYRSYFRKDPPHLPAGLFALKPSA